jgi:hypothetical protein
LAHDAFASGAVNGVNDTLDLADPTQNCTANDVRIAVADLLSYSIDGTTFIPFTPGDVVSCQENTPIFLNVRAHVEETATSERTDIGIWIGLNGGNARTGVCNHYNLVNGVAGVSNIDGDSCGDMVNAQTALVPLGVIDAVCQTATPTSTTLHIGSCIGWTQPGGDQVCPQGGNNTPDGFRFGTVPGTTSKCNCSGFDVPITVNRTAKLEVVKACTPSNDNGTFDLLIDGSNQFANSVACGGTTGAQTLSAGTNQSPGALHTFGEGDFTTANYTSSFSCVNRLATGPQHTPFNGTSLGPVDITLLPNEDVICTYTNVRLGSITIVKDAIPNDAQDFAFTTTGTGLSGFSLDDDADATLSNTKTFSGLAAGAFTVIEGAVSGWSLTGLSCTGGGANTSTSTATRTATIGLDPGENVTCTFENTKLGSVTIIKDDQNPATDAEDFAFSTTGTGFSPFDLDDDADATLSNTKVFSDLLPGARTVTEGAETNWDLTAINCVGGGANTTTSLATRTASIGVDAGETITCTFVNQRKARLRVQKLFPGGVLAFDFSRNPGGVTFSLTDQQINDSGFLLAPGTYRVCELNNAVTFSATATLDGAPATLVNPDFPADLGNRCVDVTLAYGGDRIVVFTNTPPPGGDARTIGYWKNWSSCTGGKQYDVATRKNLLDKTLDFYLPSNPAVFPIGDITSLTCPQAVLLLDKSDIVSGKKMASDPAYNLAAQLFAAKLNYAAGAKQCPAATTAIAQAQALLDAINFTGTGAYKNSMTAQQQTLANSLAATLDSYNNNTLACP